MVRSIDLLNCRSLVSQCLWYVGPWLHRRAWPTRRYQLWWLYNFLVLKLSHTSMESLNAAYIIPCSKYKCSLYQWKMENFSYGHIGSLLQKAILLTREFGIILKRNLHIQWMNQGRCITIPSSICFLSSNTYRLLETYGSLCLRWCRTLMYFIWQRLISCVRFGRNETLVLPPPIVGKIVRNTFNK